MKNFSRRDFLMSTGGLFALTSFRDHFPGKIKPLKLSFSTLGCPDWTLNQIIDFAAANKYQGVEIRGIQRVMDLDKSPHFDTPAHIAQTRQLFGNKNLKIVDLGSSAELHIKDPAERKKSIDGAKKFIDIAGGLGCPYVRVFPNHFPKEQTKEESLDLIKEGLTTLSKYAKGSNVSVLMETHGDLIKSDEIVSVMESVPGENTGLIWDIINMWSEFPEDPALVYPKLKKYIRHTHIKDMKKENGVIHYELLGKGQTPIFEAVDLLLKDGYAGYFSFEWEKMWHPEIAEPEVALSQYPVAMMEHYEKLRQMS